jgi:hypothetical protein
MILRWALIAACVFLFIAHFHWPPSPLAVRMEIRTEQAARLLLPYYSGSAAVEDGYVVRMVDSRSGFQSVRFPIDRKQLSRFRLVQVDGAGTIQLRNIRIERFGGNSVPVGAVHLRPVAGIASISRVGDAIEIRAQAGAFGTDMTIKLPKPVRQRPLASFVEWLIVALLGCTCLTLLWVMRALSPAEVATPLPLGLGRDENRTRTWIVTLLTLLYMTASVCGLNGSSSAAWRFYADREEPDASLVLGSAKHIRSDEWQVQTAWILSQAAQKPSYPLINPAVGDGPAPLICSLPVRHWSILFRPQFLGFFFLKLERAFAIYWN